MASIDQPKTADAELPTTPGSPAIAQDPPPGSAACCPLCGGVAGAAAFPYGTHYNGTHFRYFACRDCDTRFIDPVPDAATMVRMYAPDQYHDQFYEFDDLADYAETVAKLVPALPAGARILDYGCGAGHFVRAARARGFDAVGAEFSADAAQNAAQHLGATVYALDRDDWIAAGPWDCIHLGDVIEHLPDPRATLRQIVAQIRPGGYLSVTGPLEANRSLVFAAIRFYDWAKAQIGRAEGEFAPFHIYFTDAKAQRAFFDHLGTALEQVSWQTFETGWPYHRRDPVRDMIARAAIAASRIPGIGAGLGNRFRALFRLR